MKFSLKLMRWCPVIAAAWLFGCGHGATAQEKSGRISLALEGYNYTNRYIDSFSVNGQGGGNIYVSSPTSGGGGTVCCMLYRPGPNVKIIRVRWQSDACYFKEQSSLSKKMYDSLHPLFKEQEVQVEVLASATDAKYMEVHFYPDGSVKAAVTATISPPRLLLEEQREDLSRYPRCPNDRKPQE